MSAFDRMRRLFGVGATAGDTDESASETRTSASPRRRIDRRRPDALAQRAERCFGAPDRKVVVVSDGATLRILLASIEAPQADLLAGLRPLLAGNALCSGAHQSVRLHRLRPGGSLSAGLDVTAVIKRIGGHAAAVRAVTAKVAFRPPATPALSRADLTRHRQARRTWPELAPFYASIDETLQVHTAETLRRILSRPGSQCYFAPDGSALQILLASKQAPQLACLTSLPRGVAAAGLNTGEYDRVLLRRLDASGKLSRGWDLTSAMGSLRPRPELIDRNVASNAHPGSFRLGQRAYGEVFDEYETARALRPDLGAFIRVPPLTEAEAAGELRALTDAMDPVERALTRAGSRLLVAFRQDEMVLLLADASAPQIGLLGSEAADRVAAQLAQRPVGRVLARRLHASGRLGPVLDGRRTLSARRWSPQSLASWFKGVMEKANSIGSASEARGYFEYLELLRQQPGLIDFVYHRYVADRTRAEPGQVHAKPPFDRPSRLPSYRTPKHSRRAALFLHNNYYQFNVLAAALRRRGWDAETVSVEPPDSPDRQFMDGEDVNLFQPDPMLMRDGIRAYFGQVGKRFSVVHFIGQGVGAFFPDNFESSADPHLIPWDLMELRRQGVIIGFTPSGCLDGPRQSSIREVSGGVCGRCVWELRPDVCNDAKNGAWARKLEALCDWVSVDGDWAVDERTGLRAVRSPVVTVVDPTLWRPDIEPPEDMRLERAPGEFLVYHAVGNYATRRKNGRDIKGTGAVIAAVEALKAEGMPVRLIFATDIPSNRVRFLQVQADVVIDQLNYGRHGANARECFMLAKPVIARVEPRQGAPLPPLRYMLESPAAPADEATVYSVLKAVLLSPERRERMAVASRAFALKWHDPDISAVRFERVIDRIDAGLAPEHDEVFA